MPLWLIPATVVYFVLAIARFRWALFVLIALLPIYLVRFNIGSLPSTALEMMVWVVVAVWVISGFRTFRFAGFRDSIQLHWPLSLGIILLIVAGTISMFIAPDLRAAAGLWKAYIIEPIAFFIVFITTFWKEDAQKIIFALSLTALATAAFAIYQKFTGWGIPNPYWAAEATRRVTSVWGFPNAIGLFLAPLIPLFLWMSLRKKQTATVVSYYLLVALLSILAIIFAKSTGALVGLAAALVITGVLSKKTRIATLVLALLGTLAILFIPAAHSIKQELLFQDRSGQIRLDMWGEGVELLSEHPILGAGLSSYRAVIHRFRIDKWIEIYQYPHNIILNFWIELGVLGVLAFILIFYWLFKTARATPALLAACTVILIHGLVDVPYLKNDLAIQFWLLAALCYNTLTYER